MSLLRKVTIEPIVVLYVFAIFAEYSVIEDLIYVGKCVHQPALNITWSNLHLCTQHSKKSSSNNSSQIDPLTPIFDKISKETNNFMLIYNCILYSTSIMSSFIAATYADRRTKFGPIFIPTLGSALVQIVIITSLLVPSIENLSFIFSQNGLTLVLLCAFISGVSGGTSTLLSSCFAYVAECSGQSKRTLRITVIEACLFGGGFFGFTYSGSILRAYPNSFARYYYNFGIFFTIHCLLGLYIVSRQGMFSQPSSRSMGLNRDRLSCGTLFTSVLKTIFRPRREHKLRQTILLILTSFTIISLWNVTITNLLFIYTRNRPLGWPTWMYSYFSSLKFALCGLFLIALPLLESCRSRTRFNDLTIIIVGLVSRALSIIFIGLATDTPMMIVALCTIIFAEYPIPAIRSLLSKIVESNEKAQIFVFMAMIQSMCFFAGSIILPTIYNHILDRLHAESSQNIGPFNGPGLIFIVVGIMQFVTIALLFYSNRVISKEKLVRPNEQESINDVYDDI